MKEETKVSIKMPLFEDKELEMFDNNIHNIVEEYSKLHLEKKEQILTQRIIIKQEQEIEYLKSIIKEAREYIENENTERFGNPTYEFALNIRKEKLLEILDKENKQ